MAFFKPISRVRELTGGHHYVPDADAPQKEGGADGQVDQELDPPGQLLDPFQSFPGDLDVELFGGLVGFDNLGDRRGHGGHIIPGGAAEVESVGEQPPGKRCWRWSGE